MTCPAYPDRIPLVIVAGEIDHLVVRPGQVGDTVFEPKPDRRREPVAAPAASATAPPTSPTSE